MQWPLTESSKLTLLSVLTAGVVAFFYICPFRGLHEGIFYLTLAVAAGYSRKKLPSLLQQRLFQVALFYVVYQWIALSWSSIFTFEELGEAIRKGIFSLSWMGVIAVISASTKRDELWLPFWVIAAAVSAGLGLLDHSAYGIDMRFIGFGRSENAVQAGCLLGIALLVVFYLVWKNRSNRAVAAIYSFCWTVLLLALLATQSRGALLAAVIAHSIFLFPWWKRLWPMALALFIAIISLADWQNWLARADGFRLEIWQYALEEWQLQPILGLGFRTPFEQTLSNGQVVFQPHSLYIASLYHGGIIGLILLMIVWAFAFKQAYKFRSDSLLPMILLVYGFVVALFDFDLLLVNVRSEWLLFWLPWGMTLGLSIGHQASSIRERKCLKILHSLFSNGIGGTERHLAELASAQAAAGHEVIVMLRADRNPYDGRDALRDWLDPRVQVITAPRRWPLLPLMWHIRQIAPDIIHTHHRRDSRYLGLAAPYGTPVIGTLHLPYRRCDYKYHDGIICIAPWQMKTLPEIFQPLDYSAQGAAHSVGFGVQSPQRTKCKRITLIPNWITPFPQISAEERQNLRATLGGENQRILGCVGRLTEEKGMVELVQAFLQLPLSDVVLCIFGEGECRPQIEKLIQQANAEKRILLKGYDPDIRRWYAAMDGFVLPSKEESFGLVLLEAMAARLPILSTCSLGAQDVLGSHSQVHWAECGNIESLKTALAGFLPHLGEQWEYPELEQYSSENAFVKIMAFYENLLTKIR